jgi:hypothetical protein
MRGLAVVRDSILTQLLLATASLFATEVRAQSQLPPIVIQEAAKKAVAPAKQKSAATAPRAEAPPTLSPAELAAQEDAAARLREADLVGRAVAGSQGVVPKEVLETRPVYRVGEFLEVTPGLIVTQHSGEGKANQYFLRGFNLDHGTDLAITADGMPINMRTHGHGQGYADTNFLIPELVRSLEFRKGPYYAEEGDFASAGAIHLDYLSTLPRNFGQIEVGSFNYRRAVAGMSVPVGLGTWLLAGEYVYNDGPWERPDEFTKLNGVLRYSQGNYDNGFAITGMAYSGRWFSTDQIPERAVDSGLIDRFGTLDPTDGGRAERYSLSARWGERDADQATRANAYVISSSLRLFNNFTYFLDDPVSGDQFKQLDSRTIAGANASRTYFGTVLGGLKSETTFGVQTRYDDIHVGLFKTLQRQTLSTVREDNVSELSVGVWGQNTLRWTDWFRTVAGVRSDYFYADVKSDLTANSGTAQDAMTSPKLSLIFGPWAATELYLNGGWGFHSNDVRGTTIRVDPTDPLTPLDRVPMLVRSKGAEVGVRFEPSRKFKSTLAGFLLDYDSELVFVGDAGTTEASRPSRRIGVEFTMGYQLTSWLGLALDAAYTQARFTADDPAAPGRHIPGAVEGVVNAGIVVDNLGGWFGGLRLRYLGPRPLIEDNSVRSGSTTLLSGRIGYRFSDTLAMRLDVFNVLNSKAHQIDYFYESRLAGEPAPVSDVHFHPVEPLSWRFAVTKLF